MELNENTKINFGIFGIILVFSILAFSTIYIVNEYTGMLALDAKAGSITTVDIVDAKRAYEWHGLMGVSVMVQAFKIQQKTKVDEYGIDLLNLLFPCMEYNRDHEIYASPTLNISWDTLTPATPEFIDQYFNISPKAWDSAANTFQKTMWIEYGNTNITNIPATNTYQNSHAQNSYFPLGIMKDGNGNPVFVTKIEPDFIEGYTGDVINYQMMVALPQKLPITYYFFTDPHDECPEGYGVLTPPGNITGTVTDKATGLPLSLVRVIIGGEMDTTDGNGTYKIIIPAANYYITALKAGYKNYVENISVVPLKEVVKNIQMEKSEEKQGDYTNPSGSSSTQTDVGPGQDVGPNVGPYLERPKKTEGIDHYITVKGIDRILRLGQFFEQDNYLFNFKNETLIVDLAVSGNISDVMELDKTQLIVKPNSHEKFNFVIFGKGDPGMYNGTIKLSGAFDETIPVKLLLTTKEKLPIEVLLMDVIAFNTEVYPGRTLKFKVDLKNLLEENPYNVTLKYSILDPKNNVTVPLGEDKFFIETSLSVIKGYPVSKELDFGDKILEVKAEYLEKTSTGSSVFTIIEPFLVRKVFGKIPIWYIIVFVVCLNAIGALLWFLRRNMESKKRYHLKVDYKTLPQKGPSRNVLVGRIAETNKPFYFDIDKLTTHCIVAGSTGGGKTISAQVIVEECLKQDIAVIVFDPTAQWSGFLRKCDNEVMLKTYPDFGLKREDARSFNGNVRQIQDAREKINLKKYFKPGEIQVLTTDKLDPSDIDIFVTNTVREVFHEHFGEASELKFLIIYDEVHRLLPRFGGSGEGFIQIERACREFRKWGIGVMLVSQVLSDFAAQIKANINTEIQMRTRDEEDLKRITTKYGKEILRSLVKATVGTGMIENPAWNIGKPFFATLRPILHSTYRLSDEELAKYNKYNEIIEDYDFQIQQLKDDGEDVFDLELELKLGLNKVKQGNFNMVDIYIDGLKPELEKRWQKIGKKPVHKKIELVNMDEIKREFNAAKKEREKFMSEMKTGEEAKPEEVIEEKAEDIFIRNVGVQNAINFDNGQTAMSIAEMLDIIEAMDDATFSRHVTNDKNDIANWLAKVFKEPLLVQAVQTASKDELLKNLKTKRTELIERSKQEIEKRKQARAEGKEEKPKEEEQKSIKEEEKEEKKPRQKEEETKQEEKKPERKTEAEEKQDNEPKRDKKQADSTPEEKKKEAEKSIEDTLKQSLKSAKEEFRKIVRAPNDSAFVLPNGFKIYTITELPGVLKFMDNSMFEHHVNSERNDFANWIEGVFGEKELAARLRMIKSKDKMISEIEKWDG